MNCEILDIIYLRANGEIPCNCATGERVNLDWMDDRPDWSVSEVLENDRYTAIRAAFAGGRVPWGKTCDDCVFLQRAEPVHDLLRQKRIAKFHLEPSLACALRCPGCSRAAQAAERRGPTFLRLDLFERMLAQLRDGGYAIDFFFLCGQGEPLSHPGIHLLIDLARRYYPQTPITINTNGNYDYAKVMRGRFVDNYIVSIDGLRQASYEQYRINGDVEQALRFMRDAKRLPQERVPTVEWKYILFRYNDSDEELIDAQHRAEELGIDSLWFVLTHTREHSERYTAQNIADLPLVSSLAYAYSTPQNSRVRRALPPQTSPDVASHPNLAAAGWLGGVEDCHLIGSQLFLTGWVQPPPGEEIARIGVLLDGVPTGRAVHGIKRPDLAERLGRPQDGLKPGFRFLSHLASEPTREFSLTLAFETAGGGRQEFSLRYEPSIVRVDFNPDNNY
jgi:organic radical activating enzyme